MLSALYGISRLGCEVTHPRLHGELVAEVRLGPGALLNLQLFRTCQIVWVHRNRCATIQINAVNRWGWDLS